MTIRVYATPKCPCCKMAESFLNDKGVSYGDLRVSVDAEAGDEMIKMSGRVRVPVNDVDGEVIIGFDHQRLRDPLEATAD